MSKYPWSLRRFWLIWFKQSILAKYYKLFHGIKCGGLEGTHFPKTGKGKYVSVEQKGNIIVITSETDYLKGLNKGDQIRIIPYVHNHGIFVETWKGGKMRDRNILSIDQLMKSIIYASNVEQLTKRTKSS